MDHLDNTSSDLQAAIDYIQKNENDIIGKVVKVNEIPFLIKKNGFEFKDLSTLLDAPQFIDDTAQLSDVDSFIEYYNRFCNDDSTIYYDIENAAFNAVIDHHHNDGQPEWGKHIAKYTCPKTPEWKSWLNGSGAKMDQEAFSLFIEDNLNEILEPTGTQMLDVVSSLEATKNVNFRSALRLDNGQTQLNYVENIEGQAGTNGQLSIPSTIKLGMRLFAGGEGYEIDARFRYRIKNGSLIMWYELIRPHKVNEAAIEGILSIVKEKMNKGYLLNGSPN